MISRDPLATLSFLIALSPTSLFCQFINIVTQHSDAQRTGANIQEVVLNHQNVSSKDFGKLWEYPVRGRIYAQPLYITVDSPGAGGTHHSVIVATAENFIYS